jgi:hypothetical protein
MSDQRKLQQLSTRLKKLQLDLSNERGEIVNQEDLAEYISKVSGKRVSSASLGHWMRGARLPEGHNIDALWYAIGDDIYKILDMEYFTPANSALRYMEGQWPKLSPEERQQIMNIIKESEEDDQPQMSLAPIS